MGISLETIRFLVRELRDVPLGERALTLGVQGVEGSYDEVRRIFSSAGWAVPALPDQEVVYDDVTQFGCSVHQSVLFRLMGYGQVESMDVFDHEHPTHMLDLNRPVPEALRGAYDLVYDGGTVEHVFSPKDALFNVSALLKPGGVVVHHLPVNGYVNHGYYQFSPQLFFDYYGINGYTVLKAFLSYRHGGTYYQFALEHTSEIPQQGLGDEALIYFVARKPQSWREPRIPLQGDAYRAAFIARHRSHLEGRKVMVWGSGRLYEEFYRPCLAELGEAVEVVGFIDNDERRHGSRVDARPVFSPRRLTQGDVDAVVIASMYRGDILGQIWSMLGDSVIVCW